MLIQNTPNTKSRLGKKSTFKTNNNPYHLKEADQFYFPFFDSVALAAFGATA